MKLAKENKGITLVTLVVTIIVIMILSFASAYSISGNIQYSHFMQVKNEMKTMKANVDLWNEKYKDQTYNTILSDLLNHVDESEKNDIIDDMNITEEMYNSTFFDAFVDNNLNNIQTIDINNATNDYKYFTGEIIKKYLDIEGVNNDFLINIKTRDVRLAFGWKYQGDWYYTLDNFGLSSEIESNLVSSVSYTLDYGINPRNANETDIFLQDLKFYDDQDNEVNISKFEIEYTKAGESAKKVRVTSSADLVEYNSKPSYVIPVDNLGEYTISIAKTGGEYFQNKENVEDSVDVKIPQITFDANGGQVNATTKYVKYEDEYGELPIPTRDGYEFLGWNGKNLFNKTLIDNEHYLISANGNISNNSGPNKLDDWASSDFICVKPNTIYIKSGTIGGNTQDYFDENKDFILMEHVESGQTFTTPEGCYYVKFNLNRTNSPYDDIQLEEGNVATEYEPYYITSDTTVVQGKNHTLTAKWEKRNYLDSAKQYVAVDYIESTGTQYIDTGIKGSSGLRAVGHLALTKISNTTVIAGSYGDSKRFYLGCTNTEGKIGFTYINTVYSDVILNINQKYKLDVELSMGTQVLKIDDQTILSENNNDNIDTGYDVLIFGYTLGSNGYDTRYPTYMRLYDYQIYSNDVLVRDFKPCYRKSDGVNGLYDVLNNVFYPNASESGEDFVRGPEE